MSFKNVVSKSELLREKKELQATEVVDRILSTKKDVLIQRLSEKTDQAAQTMSKYLASLTEMYITFQKLYLELGEEELVLLSKTQEGKLELNVKHDRFMDVNYTIITGHSSSWILPFTGSIYELFNKGEELISSIVDAAWTRNLVLKIIKDLKDTDRLMNAIERIAVPEHQERIAYISFVLEEREREELTRTKKVREKLVKSVV
jgi:V/A-type H+-transporting ATPase subunit D